MRIFEECWKLSTKSRNVHLTPFPLWERLPAKMHSKAFTRQCSCPIAPGHGAMFWLSSRYQDMLCVREQESSILGETPVQLQPALPAPISAISLSLQVIIFFSYVHHLLVSEVKDKPKANQTQMASQQIELSETLKTGGRQVPMRDVWLLCGLPSRIPIWMWGLHPSSWKVAGGSRTLSSKSTWDDLACSARAKDTQFQFQSYSILIPCQHQLSPHNLPVTQRH